MKSKHPDLSRATRRTPLVLILALVMLVVLAGTVWAAWGAARSLPVGLSAWLDVDATATATRTPRPVTITPTPIPLESGDPRAYGHAPASCARITAGGYARADARLAGRCRATIRHGYGPPFYCD